MVGPMFTPASSRMRYGAASNPVSSRSLSQYTANVPGARATGYRGPASNAAAQSRISTTGSINSDPLVNYQNKIRERLEQSKKFSSAIVQTRAAPVTKTGFQTKYGIGGKPAVTQQKFVPAILKPGAATGNSAGYRPAGQTGHMKSSELARAQVGGQFIPQAASALDRLNVAFKARFGRNISVTDSYRSYQQQVAVKKSKGNLAAKPGTSVHGSGRAADLGGGINKRGSAEYNWMMQNAPKYGWVNPKWAQTTKIEPWHWEYVG